MAKKVNQATFNYGGISLSLTKSKTKAAVQYTPEAIKSAKSKRSSRDVGAPPVGAFEVMQSTRNIDKKLDELRARPDIAVGSHVWQVGENDDTPLIPTGNLYIEFAEQSDVAKQQAVLDEFGLNIKEQVALGAYRVAVTHLSPNPIKCAILLQKKKIVIVAEPEFVTLPVTSAFTVPSGKFMATQWHLENTGGQIPIVDIPNAVFGTNHFRPGADAKVKAAWQALQSVGAATIKIAVIDTGFAIDHPQLRGDGTKIRNPFNAATRTSDVNPFVRFQDGTVGVASHGTSCAAVAAGALDTQGVLGAAPNSKIIPIKLDVLSDEAIRNAFEHALLNGADIISCSLGFPQPIPLSTFITNYLRTVVQQGRAGNGLPIFIAAGNANPASNNQPRQISDFAAHPDTICVTASNSLDERSSYSFFGPNAFLCAPTNGNAGVGITTASCDIGADQRTVILGYTSGFGGTSSAAPLVAGVCALLLTANPQLRIGDIRSILASTTDKIGPAGTYGTNGHSQQFGFGRVNALKAVQKAMAMRSGGSTGGSTGGATPAPASSRSGKVASATLNVRTGPSTGFPKVAELKKGNSVSVFEQSTDGWFRIGDGRWVLGKFVALA